jgi:hypothetical protein
MKARLERVVKEVKCEPSQQTADFYWLAVWLGTKASLRNRRRRAEKAKARKREIAGYREKRS